MGILKRLWNGISNAQTLQGLVQMFWPSVVVVASTTLMTWWAIIQEYPLPIIAVLGFATGGVFLGFWILFRDSVIIPLQKRRRAKTASMLKIVFPNEVNAPSKGGANKISSFCFLLPGEAGGHSVFKDLFRVGVENRSPLTLENVRFIVHQISSPMMMCPEMELAQSDADPKTSVRIAPKYTTYFDLGYCVRQSMEGVSQLTYVNAGELAKLNAIREQTGFVISGKPAGREIGLLKNDGYLVSVGIYADDIEPLRATFRIDAKDRTTVTLLPNHQA